MSTSVEEAVRLIREIEGQLLKEAEADIDTPDGWKAGMLRAAKIAWEIALSGGFPQSAELNIRFKDPGTQEGFDAFFAAYSARVTL